MIKVGDRFVDATDEQILLSAQLGAQGGLVRLECFPGFEESGRPDPGEVRRLLRRFEELGMDTPGLEIRRSHTKGALKLSLIHI